MSVDLSCLKDGIPASVPDMPPEDPSIPKAPVKAVNLTEVEVALAVKNALRYFPQNLHEVLAPEFLHELRELGHIYMLRFRPVSYEMKAYPISAYPAKCTQAAGIMVMIMNNLDRRVAQYPHHLITYGGNGSVFSNWAQYHLTMKYLSEMTTQQTLTLYSGHPAGLFPSSPAAPRLVITNGMMIPNYSSRDMYDRMYALGTTQYGQMTAGSFCYIGPQGIVHGTTITVLNAGRKYLGVEDMKGKVYLSSGLGGMSGAQPKAGVIAGAIAVIAEVDEKALRKRQEQGWVLEVATTPDECLDMIRAAKQQGRATSIGFLGNVVALWEKLAQVFESTGEKLVDLGSDQTSLHNPYNGGYYPVQLSFSESRVMMKSDPEQFKRLVQESLRRHVQAVNRLTESGLHFWDYGNSFLLEASRAGAEIFREGYQVPASTHESNAATDPKSFRYPSYVQDIMGDIFSLGFGPFRWVCLSGVEKDLDETDLIAKNVLQQLLDEHPPDVIRAQLTDNLKWIQSAKQNRMVVGSQARILYADREARAKIAVAFNEAIAAGKISGAVALSRDHHDVSGTDSPFRETSNIYDGSCFSADMAIQNVIGDSFRGATWVAIHNGGGVGWGEFMNGGFGLVLDGSATAAQQAKDMLHWDVNNGVARRAWARNDNAILSIQREMNKNEQLRVTLPYETNDEFIQSVVSSQ